MSQLNGVKDFYKAYRRSLKLPSTQMDNDARKTESIYDAKIFYVV